MDSVAVSRRNNKKENKENAQPANGSKAYIKSDKMSAAPFQLKNNKKEETVPKNGHLKAKAKQADTNSMPGEVLKKVKTVQRDGQGAAATEKRQTHTKAFLTEQAAKDKKTAAEVSKPPAAVPSSKPAPGMYKGKIVQSKIGSIWKSSATVGGAEPKQSGLRPESQKVGNVTKIRSKSVADLPGHGKQRPAPTRSKSVVDKPAEVSKSTFKSQPPAGFFSSRPPATTVPATITSNRNTNVVFTKRNGISSSNTKIPVTDKKVNKPPVSSTISQYRLNMETVEERRAKLAEWLASKGKTLKRPAMKAGPSKTKVSAKPEPDLKPQPVCNPEPAPRVEAHEADLTAAHCADTQGAELTHSQTPAIMNTTLELLEDSVADLSVVPQDRVDDIVVNLCDALEAMATPSRCNDELSQGTDVEVEDNNPKDECKKEQMENGIPEDVSEHLQVEQVKEEVEESDQEAATDDEGQNDDDCVMETTPQMEDASVVKYSVKTTPYLQSVKKTIEDDASTSASRRKSNIKDFKFLTPVRRSSRIHHKSSHLPAMLLDHDPCVTSLAELVKLDDNPNAYIYRKNPALVGDLLDQPSM